MTAIIVDTKVKVQKGILVVKFVRDADDGTYNEKIRMERNEFFVNLGEGIRLEDIHPDHLALAIILAANPFIGSSLKLPLPVSERFMKSTRYISRYKIIAPAGVVAPYLSPDQSRPGLSFSGGADSTAALLLMPKNTISMFMDRPIVKGVSLYNKSAAYATINHAKSVGYDVRIVESDFEYIRSPIGFPNDLSPAIPLILSCSMHGIDSIAFGTVLESAYRVGHQHARDYPNSGHYKGWGGMFSAAGIPLYMPVAGISEVGTSTIVLSSSFKDYTRSCIRGDWPQSCENCWKCFRKNLVECRLLGRALHDDKLNQWLRVGEVKYKLKAWPISHENVLSWSLQGGNTSGLVKEKLLSGLEGSVRNMDFLERWYPGSSELIPERYRDFTKNRILLFMKEMKESEKSQIINHSMSMWLESPGALKSKNNFNQYLDLL